jgi:hypothetical protein
MAIMLAYRLASVVRRDNQLPIMTLDNDAWYECQVINMIPCLLSKQLPLS